MSWSVGSLLMLSFGFVLWICCSQKGHNLDLGVLLSRWFIIQVLQTKINKKLI